MGIESRVGHELHEALLVPPTIVGGGVLAVVEVHEGGEPSDIMLLTDGVKLGAVYGSEGDFLVGAELLSSSSVLRLGSLAVPTPRRIEHHQPVLLLL